LLDNKVEWRRHNKPFLQDEARAMAMGPAMKKVTSETQAARAVRQVLTYLALRACLRICSGDRRGMEEDAESDGEGRGDALEGTGDALEDRADELGGDELEDELAGDEVAWKKTIEEARNLAGTEPEPA
jgi:hypothetical protein